MTRELEDLAMIIFWYLKTDSPVLSGNMRQHIKMTPVSDNEVEIMIEAPFYDTKIWRKEGAIVYTGPPEKWPSFTDYALWVNEKGAFAKGNKSKHWVYKELANALDIFAAKYNAEVRKG